MVKHRNILGRTNKQFRGSLMRVRRCWRKGEDFVKMGFKEIEYEVTGCQDRFSSELHISEINGGQGST